MAQDTIDKIINIQFKYSELIKGWEAASMAIDEAKNKLQEFKKEGNSDEAAKQVQRIKALRNEMAAYTREIQANVREEVKLDGSVENLRARVQALTAQYNKLSREERNNAKVGGELSAKIREIQTELNGANTSLLNFRDNVGNYASAAKGFTPLSFQVQQLARELPSLTMSLQQFFLAISNNVPMFADELERARLANEALRTEGKGTIPVFKQVLMSIASWQTALVVGITLLTAYGKEIGAWVKELFSAKSAAISMAEAQRRVNGSLAENDQGVAEQIVKFKQLQNAWNDLGNNMAAKNKFIIENKTAFDELGVKIDDVNDAENLFVANSEAFIKSLKLRAQSTASYELAVETYKKAVVEQQKADERAERSRSGYTEAGFEQLKKNLRRTSDALFAQAEAYIDLSGAREKDAKAILDAANIKEVANDKVANGVKQISTLEELQYRMREKNLDKYTKTISNWRHALAKEVSKMEADIDKAMKQVDKDTIDNFKKQLQDQELKFRNRINEAQLAGGDLGAAREMLEIYKEQLAQINKLEEAYRTAGYTDEQIQAERIVARKKVIDAEQNIANIQQKTTEQLLGGMSQAMGGFSAMFEALGGEGERYAEFSKALAVFQVILAQAEAIAKAVAAGSQAPWFMLPITIASSIAAVVAAMAQATQSLDSAKTPRYASGGLVTGPGTGTSDSIPARLSNGEAVMTAQAVNDWGAMLSAMNVASGGNAINVSNLPQKNDGMRGMERMIEQAFLSMPTPVVSVVDINKGQRRVKVQDALGKLGRKKTA